MWPLFIAVGIVQVICGAVSVQCYGITLLAGAQIAIGVVCGLQSSFVGNPRLFGSIVVPSVYSDRGMMVWRFLEDRLIAKRALRRRAELRTIVNTRLRQYLRELHCTHLTPACVRAGALIRALPPERRTANRQRQ